MDEEDQLIENMILSGEIEFAGIDSHTGEMLYSFTHKGMLSSPDIHKQIEDYFHQEIMYLWENKFIEMNITDTNPIVKLLPKALDPKEIDKLATDHRISLQIIIDALRIR